MWFAPRFRRRETGVPLASDPALLLPSGYWEQRDTGILNYSLTDTDGGGPDLAATWEDRSGNSRVWVQATPANQPTVGVSVDGSSPIVLDSVAGVPKNLTNASTIGDFGTAANLAGSMLIKPTGTMGAWNVNPYANPIIWADTSGWFILMMGKDAGVDYVGIGGYPGSWVYARAPITSNQWSQVNWEHAGGELRIEVNGTPATDPGPGFRKSVTCGNIIQIVHPFSTRPGGVGGPSTYEILSQIFKSSFTAANYTDIRAWYRQQYPSLAGVIPA